MNTYYGASVYRYFSKLGADVDFRSPELAREFDLKTATERLHALTRSDLETALREGDAELALVLRFAAEEIDRARHSKAETA